MQTQNKLGYKSKIITTSQKIKKNKNIYYGNLINSRFSVPSFFFIIKIFNEIKKYDIIHVHNFWNIFVTISILSAKISGKKIILSPHGSLHKNNIKKNFFLKIIFYFFIDHICLKSISKFHFLNQYEKKNFTFQKLLKKNNYFIIPNSVKKVFTKKKKLKMFKTKYNFSYIGRLSKNKGIELMISSYLTFKKKFSNSSLHIIGPDSNYKKVLINKYRKYLSKFNIFFYKPNYSDQRFNIMGNSTANFLLSDLECDSVLSKEVWASRGLLIITKNSFNENYYKNKIALIVKQNIRSVCIAMNKSIIETKSVDKIKENGYKYFLNYLNITKNTKKIINSY